MTNLWVDNAPEKFWLCDPSISSKTLKDAEEIAAVCLGLAGITETAELFAMSLGESRFGSRHWELSWTKRAYYLVKPALPRPLTRFLRRHYGNPLDGRTGDNWPIDPRYVLFQWEVLRQYLILTGKESVCYRGFWPDGHLFAFVLTHDIETAGGQAFIRELADLEENLGFRSCFNFVLERYDVDFGLIQELRKRGFEVGCHGLKHDGKLFNSKKGFMKKAARINAYMKEYGMLGFRAPLTHRNPEWMQALEMDYDMSFFDTDPFEPIPGGAMSIWPFFLGHFVELPYTLVQDYTLTSVLGETSPRLWLDKVNFLQKYQGMALLNSHPDYLKEKSAWKIYQEFLIAMKNRDGYWHALPHEMANWWRKRALVGLGSSTEQVRMDTAQLRDTGLELTMHELPK